MDKIIIIILLLILIISFSFIIIASIKARKICDDIIKRYDENIERWRKYNDSRKV